MKDHIKMATQEKDLQNGSCRKSAIKYYEKCVTKCASKELNFLSTQLWNVEEFLS